jgi:glutathione S-transferase
LYDSPVICEYLISIGEGWSLLAKTGVARFEILRQQAFGDGLMDGAVEIFAERNFRPEAKQSHDWIERQSAKISAALDHFEGSLSRGEASFSLGTIAIGSALTYLDLRLPELAWRQGRSSLRNFYERHAVRPSFRMTEPPGLPSQG